MTFFQLRNEVDALYRKYSTELQIHRSRYVILEICDEMADEVPRDGSGSKLPLSDWALTLFSRLRERDIRLKTYNGLNIYLRRCLEKRVLPQVKDALRSLFPKAAQRGLQAGNPLLTLRPALDCLTACVRK